MTTMNDIDNKKMNSFKRLGVIRRYKEFLPVSDATPIVSLYEGETPLIQLKNLPKKFGIEADWYVKFEGMNPTGSFKDRGMTMAISKAKEDGAKVVMCASTGNTSASAAAYAARANMACVVLIPEGKITLGKLSQAMLHGAKSITD
jgi:Threonine synthase